jgi:hypothetical protein
VGKILKIALACGAAVALPGCVQDARIAVPSDLAAASERIELTGMGGGERGRLRLGSSEGRFTRASFQGSEDGGRLVRSEGGGSFEVSGPDVQGVLAGECRFDEAELRAGSLSFPSERFAYRCRFSRGGEPIDAGLILEEIPTRPGRLLSGRTRGGEIHLGGEVVTISAVHDMEGGRLPTAMPLGYRFEIDGRSVGAVDLNGGDKTLYVPRSGPERQAVLAASLALSILWDPGE